METATKATQQAGRSTDKLLEALATLAALLDRTMNEVKALDGDYQVRMMEAVHKTEESLKAQAAQLVEQARGEVRDELTKKFEKELKTAMDSLSTEFQQERERAGFETEAERKKFHTELSQHTNAVAELQAEKSKLAEEVKNLKHHSDAEIQRVKSEAQAAVASAVSSAIPQQSSSDEIKKVEAKLAAVIQLVDDPATELSVVIRKNVEKLELEAYLKGLRFANGKS